MKKSILQNTRIIRDWTFLILILSIATVVSLNLHSENETETPIDKSEKLIIKGDYEGAIFALKPLLTSDEKSEAQEQALWLAHQLTDKVRMKIDDYSWDWTLPNKTEKDKLKREEIRDNWRKEREETVKKVNELGQLINLENVLHYFEPGNCYSYANFFLQQLIERYPNSHKRPVAEYHLIFGGFGIPKSLCLDTTLKQLHTYVDKYEKTGSVEVYKAYLEIARIHHGTWAALLTPDYGGEAERLSIEDEGDREKYKQHAEHHRTEALKYYALYHINPHGLTDVPSHQRLKKNELDDQDIIVWSC